MKFLIVCPYPFGKAANQRFRFEQYLPYLRENDLDITISAFWNDKQWPAIYGEMSIGYRVLITGIAFIKRFFLLFSLPKYSTVFIHREATPIGPAWWEWCAAKIFRKRLIYDFDDAIWLPNSSKANAKIVGKLKNHEKTEKIISWSETVFAGNAFLAKYAGQFCDDVRIVPTTIDMKYHSRESHESRVTSRERDTVNDESIVTIGWTGTHSTLKQLIPLFPLLEKVHSQVPFRFILIADQAPVKIPNFVQFRKWKKETEIADLLEINIGIMPLYDTDWERGKCGFKALQYMALGIPAIVSGVGVNMEIVDNDLNGYICEPVTDLPNNLYSAWENSLIALLKNEVLRKDIGINGLKRVSERFSMEIVKNQYLNIFKNKE